MVIVYFCIFVFVCVCGRYFQAMSTVLLQPAAGSLVWPDREALAAFRPGLSFAGLQISSNWIYNERTYASCKGILQANANLFTRM